jgi:hypothetical protein
MDSFNIAIGQDKKQVFINVYFNTVRSPFWNGKAIDIKLRCINNPPLKKAAFELKLREVWRPQNKKTNIYVLTENGLSLTPIIVELALWSDHHLRPIHEKMDLHPILDAMNQNKNEVIKSLQKDYKIKTATLKKYNR